MISIQKAQETLAAKLAETENRLEEINAQLTKAEAYNKAKTALAENQAKEAEKMPLLKRPNKRLMK